MEILSRCGVRGPSGLHFFKFSNDEANLAECWSVLHQEYPADRTPGLRDRRIVLPNRNRRSRSICRSKSAVRLKQMPTGRTQAQHTHAYLSPIPGPPFSARGIEIAAFPLRLS